MFAPPIAKSQKARAASPTRSHQRSTPTSPRLGHSAVEYARMLQRSIGNQATLRILQLDRNRTATELDEDSTRAAELAALPLVVGPVDGPLEHEANRIADQVTRMPDPGLPIAGAPVQLRRKRADCEEDEAAWRLETKWTEASRAAPAQAPGSVHDVLRSPGQPLDASARAFFEPRFGHDFSGVRLHTDMKAAESARSVNALAYTVGQDVVFATGQFAPTTNGGRTLLAHELAHVMQQTSFGDSQLARYTLSSARPMLQRQERESATAICPGSTENRTIIAVGPGTTYGVLHPKNIGDNPLRIMCYDEKGKSIKGSSRELIPGEAKSHYDPVPDTDQIAFFCEAEDGDATLEYDLPNA